MRLCHRHDVPVKLRKVRTIESQFETAPIILYECPECDKIMSFREDNFMKRLNKDLARWMSQAPRNRAEDIRSPYREIISTTRLISRFIMMPGLFLTKGLALAVRLNVKALKITLATITSLIYGISLGWKDVKSDVFGRNDSISNILSDLLGIERETFLFSLFLGLPLIPTYFATKTVMNHPAPVDITSLIAGVFLIYLFFLVVEGLFIILFN